MEGKQTPSHSLEHLARMPSPSASPSPAGRQGQGQGQMQARRPLEVDGGHGQQETTIEEQVQLWLDRHCGCLC